MVNDWETMVRAERITASTTIPKRYSGEGQPTESTTWTIQSLTFIWGVIVGVVLTPIAMGLMFGGRK